MDYSTDSISITLSKMGADEEMSISRASLEDAASRLAEGVKPETISNEKIRCGDELLGTYQVVSDAIHGGMGSVWRVLHKNWKVDLAMKRPQPRFFTEGSQRRKEEFIAECEHWIDLGLHPNIVSCYYIREIGGVPTIFSEWMDGGSLKDRIRDGSLYEGTEEEIQERLLDITIQTARGLTYSHKNGLLHQDVKPGNILLTKEWNAKIADFGLAKAQQKLEEESSAEPSEKAVLSTGYTLAYCPAEQAAGETAEPWMDRYAWAVTVLEIYAGERRWTAGAEIPQDIDKYFEGNRIRIPEELKGLLRRCLTENGSSPESTETFSDKEMLDLFSRVTGHAYPRPGADTLHSAADNLNNYALSMLDLGRKEAALQAWDKAVQTYPDHLESAVNRAFFLWRAAELSDKEVLEIFDIYPESEEKNQMLELFALESGEKQLSENGITEADVLLVDHAFKNAVYENAARIWLAMYGSLTCFDTASGARIEEITEEQAGTKLELIAFAAENRIIYTGATNHLIRVDRDAGNQISEIAFVPPAGTEIQYPDETLYENGTQYGKGRHEEVEWCSVWLEEDETVLCLMERSKWADAKKMKEFTFWCNYPEQRKYPVPPHVFYSDRYHVLRYRLKDSLTAEFLSVTRLNEQEADKLNRASAARSGRWESASWQKDRLVPISRLKDRATGRSVRSHKGYEASILAFNPDQKQYLLRPGKGSNEGYLCAVPEDISGNILYTLSRIKDIDTAREEAEKAEKLSAAFFAAFDASRYREAIRCYNEFREMPGRQDSQTLLDMEIRLGRTCTRTGLHHYSPAADLTGSDMTVFDPVEIRSFNYSSGPDRWQSNIRDYFYEPLYTSGKDITERIKKAKEIIHKALPIRLRDISGEKRKIDGGVIDIELVDLLENHSYAWIDEKEPDRRLSRLQIERFLLDVDMNTGKVTVMAEKSGRFGYPLFAPDGMKWLLMTPQASGNIKRFDKDVPGYHIPVPQGEARFSPDSGFVLLRKRSGGARSVTGGYAIASIAPADTEKDPKDRAPVELPAVPEEHRGKTVFFSADGLLLLLSGQKQKTAEPWLRLCWDYEPTEKAAGVVPPQRTRVEQKSPEPVKEEVKKPKGLFSRLFGNK